ncbi:MAG: HYR domain-containing protein [Saprospirales bacterium]|nr:MAG: HYR domain-containing protein [Saprospirales bacterium]
MKLRLLKLFSVFVIAFTVAVTGMAQSSLVLTYNAGDIESDRDFTSLGDFSDCPGVLTVTIPSGYVVTGMDVTYDITAQGGAWMSEQRSWLYSPDIDAGESEVFSGSGNSAGTFSYDRTDISFADFASGTFDVELHVGRTWPGTPTDCNTTYQFVPDGTWELTVHYDLPPPCAPPLMLSVDNVGGDFVELSWEESFLDNEDGYEWELRTEGDPGSGSVGLEQSGTVTASTLSATLSGLDGLTSYTFYIRSDCDGDFSDWVSVSFSTVPENDNCIDAIELTPSAGLDCESNAVSATTEAATNSGEDPEPSCFNASAQLSGGDVWFSFTATAEFHTINYSNVEGNPGSGIMRTAIYEGSCGDFTELDCNTSSTSFSIGDLTIGETYYIRAYTSNTDPNHFNTFDICIGTFPPPATNDLCADAINLTVSSDFECDNFITASTQGATESPLDVPSCGTSSELNGGDVWFSFTATGAAHTVNYNNVIGSTGSGFMRTAVYEGTCGDLDQIECSISSLGFDITGLTPGETYYIRAWTSNTNAEQFNVFDICIGTVPTIDDGDDCADAIELQLSTAACENQINVSTVGATNSMAIDPDCSAGGIAGGDIWFTMEATAESMAVIYSNISTVGGSGTLVTELYAGTCTGLVSLGCEQSNDPLVAEGLTVGDTYYLRVWTSSTNEDQGNVFDICVVELEDDSDCDNPFVIDANDLPYSFLDGNTILYGNNFDSGDRPGITNVQFGSGTGSAIYLTGYDVVFELHPDRDMLVDIELIGGQGWVSLWLFEDCPFSETVAYHTATTVGDRLLPEIELTDGVEYYIVVASWQTQTPTTTFDLFVNELVCELECPEDIEVSTDAGECGADLAIDYPELGEYCPDLDFNDFLENSFNNDPNASGIYPVGTTEVTYTYSDTLGEDFTCTFSVTVNDEEDPEITCPDNVNIEVDFGVDNADVDDFIAVATDNCNVASIENDYNDGGADASGNYPSGTTTVTFTATDDSGNTATCSATVNITSDDVPPIDAVCQDATVELDADGNASVDATDLDGGSTGGAGDLTFTVDGQSSVSFDCDDVGEVVLTLTVTDDLDFSETCTAIVTVEDNINPTVTCEAEVTQMVANPADEDVFVDVPATSADSNCDIVSFDNDYNDGGADASDVYSVGTTVVTYTAIDENGNEASCQTTVVVEPDLSIVALCQDASVSLDEDGNASVDAVDLDNGSFGGDGDLSFSVNGSSSIEFNCDDVGTVGVDLIVSDAAGNSEACAVEITISDDIAPAISCESLVNSIVDNVGDTEVFVDLPEAVATSNCPPVDIVNDFNDGGADASDMYEVGTTVVTFTATDANGNESTCQTTVIVVADDSIIPVCADVSAELDADGNAEVDAAGLDGGSFGGDGDLSFSVDGSSTASFDCDDVGANTVVLTVTDDSGNSETCESTVTISDNIAPDVECDAAVEVVVANPGDTEVFVDLDLATANDNCGVASIENDLNNGGADASDTYAVGTHTITYTATDVNGNTAECLTELSVLADESLVVFCKDGAVNIDASGTATLNVSDLDDGSFGGEGDLTFTVDGNEELEFDCDDLGSHTVTVEVTDEASAVEICEVTITVDLDGVTEVTCNNNVEVSLDSNGNASVSIADLISSAEATCGIVSMEASQLEFDCDDVGSVDVVVTIENILGEEASCTAAVAVGDDNDPVAECVDITFPITEASMTFFVNPESLNGGSSATCGDVSFSFDGDTPGFTCDDIGTHTVTLVVTNDAGTTATCDSEVTVQCVEGLVEISGTVEREFGDAVPGAEMTWLGNPGGISMSQGTGLYQIFVESNSNAVVTPQKEGNPTQFITTADLIDIQRHILQIEPFSSPYQIIAADINFDNVVSTFDLVVLQSLIVGIIDGLDGPVWRFVPGSYSFDDPTNPFGEDFPEVKGYQGVVNDQLNEDWIAIKTGDVAWNSGTRLTNDMLKFNVSSTLGSDGGQYLIFETSETSEIFGYQMALNFNDNTSVEEFIPGKAMRGMNDLNFHMEDAMARTNYYNGEGIRLEAGTELFRLRINSASSVTDALDLVDIYREDRMRAEGYPVEGEMMPISLGTTAELNDAWSVTNLSPVPASDYLLLEMEVSADMDFELEVYNSNGQLMESRDHSAQQGFHSITFDLSNYASGAYFIRIVNAENSETIRFIKVD